MNGRTGEKNSEEEQKNEQMVHGFFGYFLRAYRVTFLIILGLALLGVGAVVTLPRESSPEVKIPFAVVMTAYPGASTRDVEELITKPVEDRLLNLEGVKVITSSSRLGISSVSVEFFADEDLDEAIRRLREEADKITGLPGDAELPQVIEISFSSEPIITISLGGVDDERLLSLLAEDFADELESIQGVSMVGVAGARGEEIRIVVAPERLAELGVSMGQLMGAIRSANLNAPFGQLETEGFNYDLRIVGGFENVGDISDVPILLPDGRVVPLGSIAEVKLALTEARGASRISVGGEPSKSAVTLSVVKKTGGNIVRIVDEVKEKIEEAKSSFLSEGVLVATFIDRGEFVRESLTNVTRSGAQTLVIVFALLWLFLGWRAAVITAVAIPMTFSMSFLIFDITDVTLNDISLFSLILSLGLLVDNTIVVVEGVYQEKGKKGSLMKGAFRVVNRFKKPLVGGTLTTVAAFFPMILVTGIIGQFLRVIPIVVTGTLLSSLIVALVFIPAVAVRFLKGAKKENKERWFDGVFDRFKKKYCLFIDWALNTKGFQRLFIGLLTLLLVAGFSLPFTGLLKTGLFPEVDIDFAIINVELAPGSRLEETDKVAKRVEERLQQVSDVESYAVNVGSGSSLDIGGGGSSAESLVSFYVNFNKDRKRTSIEIAEELRERFSDITEAKVVVEEISSGPPTAAPVELRIVGDSLDELDRLSQEVVNELESMSGVINVDRSLRNSAGEFNFVFDREALAENGLMAASVAQTLRASVFGAEVTTFLDQNSEEVTVRIEAKEETVDSVDDVLSLPILTPMGEEIVLGQVARVDLGTSIDAIRRRDGERVVSVTASTEGKVTPNEITEDILARIEEKGLPDGYEVQFGGEQQETTETFTQLYRSMIIAVILILLILVVEFNSYRQPLIIFLSIPLALIGVLFGLLMFGSQLNFASFIGLVSLTGIVVNNAIILVDRMNVNMRKGKVVVEAVKEAAESRLRPIILTTLTTAAGVAPLIWVDEFFRDMAITLITGLLFSSILTLVLIPILYLRQQQRLERKKLKKLAKLEV